MLIQNALASFGPFSGGGPQVGTAIVTFPSDVKIATASLTGFTAEFSRHHDHHLGQLDIQVSIPPGGIRGRTVEVTASFGLRDWSGN